MRPSPILRASLVAALLSGLAALPATAGIGRFTPFGPAGAALGVQALLVDPLPPSTVYAAAGPDFYRSTDAGGSWTLLSQGPFVRLAAAPTGPAPVLYAASLTQLFRSADSGRSWSSILSLPVYVASADLLHLAVAPTQPSRVYVAAQTDVFRSDDGGDSWTRVYSGATGVQGFVVDPRDADRLLLLDANRVVASADGGSSWSAGSPPLLLGFTIYPQHLAQSPSRPEVLYVSGLFATCRSADSGASFLCQYSAFPPSDLLVDPTADSTVYAADPRGGVAVSDDGGGSWQRLRQGLPRPLYRAPTTVLASDPTTGGLFVGTPDRAVQRIVGRAWQPASEAGLLPGLVSWMQFRPGHPAEIYLELIAVASLNSTGVVERSRDGGQTWTQFAGSLGFALNAVKGLIFEPADPAVFYAYTGDQIFRSPDDGLTWTALSPRGIQGLVSAGRRTLLASGCGVQRSVDGGTKWAEVLACVVKSDPVNGDVLRQVQQIVTDPTNPATVYAVTLEGLEEENPHDPTQQTPYLYKSVDSGARWHRLPAGPSQLAVAPGRPQTLYAVVPGGLLRSDDGGGSFRVAGTSAALSQVASLVVDPHDPDVLYATVSAYPNTSGVQRSIDGGASWQPVNAGLPRLGRLDVRTVVADPVVPDRIFALPTIGGLFVSVLGAP